MKYRLFIWLFLLGALAACKDDEETSFDVPVEFKHPLAFREIPGGAVMKYYLPDNAGIFGVRVRYTDAFGNQMMKDGSYLSDSLILSGFTEARKNVPAQVTFFNSSMVETEPLEVTFNTLPSATIAVFDELTVNPYWGGFNVTYQSPETVSGMIHVFYLGINPKTKLQDSILMASFPIQEGGDTLNFVLKQAMDSTDVIVRTDDFKGYRVHQKVFKKLPCLSMDTLDYHDGEFDFRFTGKVWEDETYQFGQKYLFDGDKKGTTYRQNKLGGERYKYATFVTERDAFGERFIIDLKEERIPASVRLYAFLNYQTSWPLLSSTRTPEVLNKLWNGSYLSKLPCKVKLYGTNENPETVALDACAPLFTLDDDPDNRLFRKGNYWTAKTDEQTGKYHYLDYFSATDAEVEAAEPVFLDMLCNYTGAKYRYLIFVVTDTYDAYQGEKNTEEYITFNELEVFIKAEKK